MRRVTVAGLVMAVLAIAGGARADDAPAPPPPLFPACDAPVVPNTLNGSVTLNNVYWQPKGGEVPFKIEGLGSADQNTIVLVCFRYSPKGRWTESPSVRKLSSNNGVALISATVPKEILDPDLADRPWATLGFTANGEVRVIVLNSDKKPIFWDTQPIGISSIFLAAITAVVAVLLTWIFLNQVRKARNFPRGPNWILSVISDGEGYASLSQFQIMLWTFVIGASAVYVMVLSGSLLSISDGTLVLLGISGVAVGGAKLNEITTTSPNPAPPPPPAVAPEVPVTASDPVGSRVPQWSDLVVNTVKGDEIDVTRVQMLFFTVVAAVFVLLKVVNTWVVPDIPTNFLLLIGISNGVYVTSKFVRR